MILGDFFILSVNKIGKVYRYTSKSVGKVYKNKLKIIGKAVGYNFARISYEFATLFLLPFFCGILTYRKTCGYRSEKEKRK